MKQPAPRNIGHEPGGSRREARPVDALGDIVEHSRWVAALLGEFRLQPLREYLRPGTVCRGRLDLIEIGQHVVERLPAEFPATASSGEAASRSRSISVRNPSSISPE